MRVTADRTSYICPYCQEKQGTNWQVRNENHGPGSTNPMKRTTVDLLGRLPAPPVAQPVAQPGGVMVLQRQCENVHKIITVKPIPNPNVPTPNPNIEISSPPKPASVQSFLPPQVQF